MGLHYFICGLHALSLIICNHLNAFVLENEYFSLNLSTHFQNPAIKIETYKILCLLWENSSIESVCFFLSDTYSGWKHFNIGSLKCTSFLKTSYVIISLVFLPKNLYCRYRLHVKFSLTEQFKMFLVHLFYKFDMFAGLFAVFVGWLLKKNVLGKGTFSAMVSDSIEIIKTIVEFVGTGIRSICKISVKCLWLGYR